MYAAAIPRANGKCPSLTEMLLAASLLASPFVLLAPAAL
eukprot:CAMPEP_0197273742 /NCGR_PEP_ID=MMETSP1432-20130617/11710_1 /TAXON_ID=44447 /ORGANISM="Pseudo-nitzschia delicatissima, Strain UNC1205" /LENGTH=38 /DNA_ID= /DNA_START= /DNA_END= /DNA_ORIENTATION=